MRLCLLDVNKIYHFDLPVKINGSFLFSYKDPKTKIENILNVEEINNKWKLKSNGNINIVINNQIMAEIELNDFNCISLKIGTSGEQKYLFCLPSNDKNVTKYSVENIASITIGSDPNCNIIYSNPLMAPNHLSLVLDNGEYYVVPINDNNIYSYLNNERIIRREKLHVGDVIFINGLKIIWMRKFIVVNNPNNGVRTNSIQTYVDSQIMDNTKYAPVSEEDSSAELYNEDDYFSHTPRLRTVFEHEMVQIDQPPPNQNPNEDLPFLLSVGTGLVMAASSFFMIYQNAYNIYTGSTTLAVALPMLLLSVLMLFSSLVLPRLTTRYQKKKRAQREKLRQDKFGQYVKEKEEYIQRKIKEQVQIMTENNLPLEQCRDLVLSNSRNVWNRELKDDDFLSIRLGIGTYPSSISINAPVEHFSLDDDNLLSLVYGLPDKYKIIENVPVAISLSQNNIISFLFDCSFKDSFVDGLILQIATYHSALDLKIVVFSSDENAGHWDYLKKMPHVWSSDRLIRFFATNTEEAKVVTSYLEKEFLTRQASFKPNSDDENSNVQQVRDVDQNLPYTKYKDYYLILTDDFSLLRGSNFVTEFFKEQVNLGFSLVIFDNSMRNLPQECETFVVIDEKECGIFNKELKSSSLIKFKADYDPTIDMQQIATKLSNIPIQSQEVATQLPTSMSFLEMYNVGKIEQLNVLNRWSSNNPTASLSAPIGVHTNGDLFKLDLHEKFDGPHGLIAGSTGSGKSEFIITYVLSMALNYHPYEVQFVLIDYKGGGLTGAFENRETGVHLPHLAGTITNLDTSEMNRTLVSIESELKRRQAKFNEVRDSIGESTMDIYKYQRLYREGVIKDPISHLFIISDEFAELKSQQPDFMAQLISTSRIGRSLGVHLILATQKPSGVVNDQIWSNSKFKVCLKVQSRQDSMEMLKRPEAASIKEAGRFYLQVGYDEYFDIGQSGWCGAKYVPTERIIKKYDDSVNFVNNYGAIIKTVNDLIKKEDNQNERGDQLTNIVRYLYELAQKENIETQKMWLDSLPEFIYLEDLKKRYDIKPESYNFKTIIGEYDAPRRQQQGAFIIDLTDSNTLIYGMPGSGKENLISTILYSMMINHHPKEVTTYIADFGAETLTVFNGMPHVGDTFVTSDGEKLEGLFKLLDREYERRKKKFIDFSGSYVEYNKNNDEKEPLIIIVLNAFESFQETYSKAADSFDTLFRDGAKYGITFIVSTSVANSIRNRTTQYFANKIVLRMPNDGDYRDLIGSPRGMVPANMFGRGIALVDEEPLEVQTAYITQKENINSTIRNTGKYLADSYKYKAPKLPVLPQMCSVDEILFEMNGLTTIPIGIERNTLEVYVYDFTINKINLIISNYMSSHIYFIYALIREFLLNQNVKVKVIDALSIYKGNYGGVDVFTGNFDNVINQIYNDLQSEKNSPDTTIYIMIGISVLKDKLSQDYKTVYENIFANVNSYEKSLFIFADDYASIKKIQVDEWYRNNVDNSYGIWLGEGAGDQMAISIATLSFDDKKIAFPFIGYPIYKGNHMIIKYVIDGMEVENEK